MQIDMPFYYFRFFYFSGDLGMEKSSIVTHIEQEALCMIELLSKSMGEPIYLNSSLNIAVTNIVWVIIAGSLCWNL